MQSWLDSIYSDTTENYVDNPFPHKGDEITISVRVINVSPVKNVLLRYREYGFEKLVEMHPSVEKELAYYKAKIKINENRLCYQFYFVTDDKIYYYTQHRITDYIPDEGSDFVILADYLPTKWVASAVFYQIFPERFCDGIPSLSVQNNEYSYEGHSSIKMSEWDSQPLDWQEGFNLDFFGGDLQGIVNNLDYLTELGINALYLNPIFTSPSTHKYDSLTYFEIDKHLGGNESLETLIHEAHKRGLKVMMDISINHVSSDAEWFNKSANFYDKEIGAYNNVNSEEREYFFFDEANNYDTWCGIETMPKLNYSSEKLRDCIYRRKDSALKKWILEPYGIDGWRFDVAECIGRNATIDKHAEVLEEIRKNLKELKEDIYILAEDWTDCSEDLQGSRWDATMNYFGCTRPIREYVGEKDLFNERNEILAETTSKLTAQMLVFRLTQFMTRIPGAVTYQMFNLLDSHDVGRLYNSENVSEEDYKLALLLLFAIPGGISIYYGDEVALQGSTAEGCRYPMNWNWSSDKEAVERRELYKKLVALKRNSPALGFGGFKIVSAEEYTIAIARFTAKEAIFFICSTDDTPSEVVIPLKYYGFENSVIEEDELGNHIESYISNSGVNIKVPPHTGYIIKIEGE